MQEKQTLKMRFREYYPVVIDIETSGFDKDKNALLEIAAIMLKMDDKGYLSLDERIQFNIQPYEGAILDPHSLAFTGIDPTNPLRNAVDEKHALTSVYELVKQHQKANDCKRTVIVAHNAHFDLGFLNSANERCNIKKSPFHPFATLDTASLSGLFYGQTVLAKACAAAEIEFDQKQAHSALYDTEKTAILFCKMVNQFKDLGGWPLS